MVQKYVDKLGPRLISPLISFFDELPIWSQSENWERLVSRISCCLDLLRLFVLNQGTVYSKEFLVENVWKQPYDPSVHDNKIYVTIKRFEK